MEKIRPIRIAGGNGEGITPLAAFHESLRRSGVENYNLLTLSSVIPPGSVLTPTVGRVPTPESEFGQRLYVVAATQHSQTPGAGIAAGIGWTQFEGGRGYFVEHHYEVLPEEAIDLKDSAGGSDPRWMAVDRVILDIQRSLRSLEESALEDIAERNLKLNPRITGGGMSISAFTVKNRPACAFTVAVYEPQEWRADIMR